MVEVEKQRYMAEVRYPTLYFIATLAQPLSTISSQFRADPRPNGGSLFHNCHSAC